MISRPIIQSNRGTDGLICVQTLAHKSTVSLWSTSDVDNSIFLFTDTLETRSSVSRTCVIREVVAFVRAQMSETLSAMALQTSCRITLNERHVDQNKVLMVS
ncbi:hypothetical protein QQF64_021528 [Cirrhinus molitorella]|uniref:Uncharacterized protein n=1 Tax=Cirrhinus molitorella TaxID=172907 RepID=A0ABR3L5L1_9TELE